MYVTGGTWKPTQKSSEWCPEILPGHTRCMPLSFNSTSSCFFGFFFCFGIFVFFAALQRISRILARSAWSSFGVPKKDQKINSLLALLPAVCMEIWSEGCGEIWARFQQDGFFFFTIELDAPGGFLACPYSCTGESQVPPNIWETPWFTDRHEHSVPAIGEIFGHHNRSRS